MSSLTPFTYGPQQVRAGALPDGEPCFVLADVCRVLGHTNPTVALRMLESDEYLTLPRSEALNLIMELDPRVQSLTVLRESGLYTLIMRSNVIGAHQFRRWVTHEVLPAIRKTGSYQLATLTELERARLYVNALEENERQRLEIEAARPAVEFVQNFVSSEGTYLVREVAAVLGVRAMGQNNLFDYLRRKRVLIGDGESKNLPYREQIEAGRFEVKVATRDNSRTGQPVGVRTVRVTPKGLDYIRRLLTDDGFTCTGSVAC